MPVSMLIDNKQDGADQAIEARSQRVLDQRLLMALLLNIIFIVHLFPDRHRPQTLMT